MNIRNSTNYPELTVREKAVFRSVVDNYIRDVEPVGSRRLAKEFNLSPATIRNIMADLEDYGLLEQPHVSSGRIPSDKGYRYFVDNLEKVGMHLALCDEDRRMIKESIDPVREINVLMKQVTDMLSQVTHYAAVVSTPKVIDTVYKRIQFIRLGERRVLAVFISKSGIVQNKIVITDQDYSQDFLDRISNLLNERFEQKTLREIREELTVILEEEQLKYDKILDAAAKLGELAIRSDLVNRKEEIIIEGATNILNYPEVKDLSRIKDLLKTFNERNEILRLLNRCLDTDGIFVAIGEETQIPEISDMSVVSSRYSIDENNTGGLGIIGPKRMPYQYIVAVVNYTSQLLSLVLKNLDNPEKMSDLDGSRGDLKRHAAD